MNAKALIAVMFIKVRLAVPKVDHSAACHLVTALQDFRAFAKAVLDVDSHLIMITTNHRAFRQCIKLHSFLLAELGLAGLLISHNSFAYFGKKLGSNCFDKS